MSSRISGKYFLLTAIVYFRLIYVPSQKSGDLSLLLVQYPALRPALMSIRPRFVSTVSIMFCDVLPWFLSRKRTFLRSFEAASPRLIWYFPTSCLSTVKHYVKFWFLVSCRVYVLSLSESARKRTSYGVLSCSVPSPRFAFHFGHWQVLSINRSIHFSIWPNSKSGCASVQHLRSIMKSSGASIRGNRCSLTNLKIARTVVFLIRVAFLVRASAINQVVGSLAFCASL